MQRVQRSAPWSRDLRPPSQGHRFDPSLSIHSGCKGKVPTLKSQWWSDSLQPCWTSEVKHLVICMDLLPGVGAHRAMQGQPSRTQVTSASHRRLWPACQNHMICVWSLDKGGCVSENIIHGSQMEVEENFSLTRVRTSPSVDSYF